MKPIAEVLAAHTAELMRVPGVVGTGEGARDGRPVVVVLVRRDDPALRARIPERLDGYAVELRVVGEVRPLGGR